MVMKKKPSIGRQKIPIAKIPKKTHLQVTFSKRRSGLFKKASELCILCGVEIVIVVFSPADKPFSFGHPEVESTVNKYLGQNHNPTSGTQQLMEAHRNANVYELNNQLTLLLGQLEAVKKQREILDEMRKADQSECWWKAPIKELALHELYQLRDALEELKRDVSNRVNSMLVESKNCSPYFGIDQVPNFETKLCEINMGAFNASAINLDQINSFDYANRGLF